MLHRWRPLQRVPSGLQQGSRLALRHCSNLATVINDLGRMRRCLSCQDRRNFGVPLSLRFCLIVVPKVASPAEICVIQANMGLWTMFMHVCFGRNAGEVGWGRASKRLRSVGSHLNGKNDQRHIICAEFAKTLPMTLCRLDLLPCQPHVTGDETTSYLLIHETSNGNV